MEKLFINTIGDGVEAYEEKDSALRSSIWNAINNLKVEVYPDVHITDQEEFNLGEIKSLAKDIVKAVDGHFVKEFQETKPSKK